MYNKVKLTKRQIKEDKFTTFMLTYKQHIQENWQYVVIGLIVVILAVVGIVYYFNSQSARGMESKEQFSRALQEYRSGNNQVAIMSFSQILESYGGESVAEHSTFLCGKINLEIRNYPEAVRYFEMYLSKYKNNALNRAAVLAGLGTCNEYDGKYQEAADKFNEAYHEYPDGPLAGDYLASSVRNYLAIKDFENARANLDIIEKDFKNTELASRTIRLFAEKNQK